MKVNDSTILRTVPAAGDLHRVPGFDPLKHLQRVTDNSGNAVLQLSLPYKRLWFRLAYPSGRLLLNPLRITDQMAIFEAQVFFQREDPTPTSSFTSTKTAQEARTYIRAAQDEALSVALDNAGFGIQLCDVTQSMDSGNVFSETPLPQAHTVTATPIAQERSAPEPKAAETAPPVPPVQTAAVTATGQATPQATGSIQPQNVGEAAAPVSKQASEVPSPANAAMAHTEQPVEAPTATQRRAEPELANPTPAEIEVVEPAAQKESEAQPLQENSTVTVLKFPVQQEESRDEPAPVDESTPVEAESVEAAPAYTEDMSIEDIAARMTMAEAQEVVVAAGPCKGWTLGQVLERRPSSLKFFITPYCEAGNIFKAAATLMYQEANQQKAG